MALWPKFPETADSELVQTETRPLDLTTGPMVTLTGLLQGSSGDKGGSEWYKTGRAHAPCTQTAFPRHAELGPGP